jgi:eukaryotic-like serine/threonine-protein kinase
MSDTIVCTDLHLERTVIVKTLKPGADSKRILDELAALQAIRSKHVVQIYDVIRDSKGNIEAIVEEYLPGNDLTSVRIPNNPDDFLRLAYPIAEGIADIHAHNRVHRDIKRQNMKYDAEGCLKIFDFGLARDTTIAASTMGEIGTPGYMAPELFEATKGGRVKFDAAIDTYAFGATLLAIALGSLPSKMRKTPPVLPCAEADFSKLSIALPAPIAAILNQCLERNANTRPKIAAVTELLGKHLLRDQHRALLVNGNTIHMLDASKRAVRLAVQGRGSLIIRYDGLQFVASEVNGHVSINNLLAVDGFILPGSCVIVLGSQRGSQTFVTVDVSHPEVLL